MSNELAVTVNKERRTVRLKITRRDYWGRIASTRQVTFSQAAFERALREADLIIPWKDVPR